MANQANHQRQVEFVALLAGLALFLSTIEYLFPRPLPFFRLGLANVPLLLALRLVDTRRFLLLAALKVVGQGLVNGTLASYVFLFSLAGSTASTAAMLSMRALPPRLVSLVGISVVGALAANVTQIALSVRFIFGSEARAIAPLFLTLGVTSGLLTGLLAQTFANRSRWLKRVRQEW